MPGMAAHHRHEEPLAGRGGVLHQIPDELHAQVHRRCEAEGRDLRRKRQVVVDGLGDVDDRHPGVDGPSDPGGAEGGVASYGLPGWRVLASMLAAFGSTSP